MPAGARVMTKDGLLGLIPNHDLRNIVLHCDIRELSVVITELRPETFEKILQRANTAKFLKQNKKDIVNPQMRRDFPGDYPIVFSYSYTIMELASKYKVGDVADAKIVGLNLTSITIEVEGVPFFLRKFEISASREGFNVTHLFSTEEMIKVYCLESDAKSAEMRWSIRALEPSPGAILLDKDKVFEEAEETAKAFYEWQESEKQRFDRIFFEQFQIQPEHVEDPKENHDILTGEWIWWIRKCVLLIKTGQENCYWDLLGNYWSLSDLLA